MSRGNPQAFIREGNFICKCGREFTKSQSFYAHQSHCKVHLGKEPKDRFGDSRRWMKGKTVDDPIYGESIKKFVHKKKDLSEILVKGRRCSTIHLKLVSYFL